jgi:hypothetical protein
MHAGIENLLTHCAKLQNSERVLIVQEDPALGWYEPFVMNALCEGLAELGIEPAKVQVGGPANTHDDALSSKIASFDCTIYLARIGDQDRFGEAPAGTRSVMCYARDQATLDSAFCTTDYRAFKQLKQTVDQVFVQASQIQIRCALGTNLNGDMTRSEHSGEADVSVLRFPLGVPTPVSAEPFTGQVALANYLTPTGNRVYEPASLPLASTVKASVDRGLITGFTGDSTAVEHIVTHYERVSSAFGIEPMTVHSWHAGIHPGCAYTSRAADNPDRWSNTVFCNPHFVHFHTCGQYAPAEICWMVKDPTIAIDGKPLWEDGVLHLDRFEPTRTCVENWPVLQELVQSGPVPLGLD